MHTVWLYRVPGAQSMVSFPSMNCLSFSSTTPNGQIPEERKRDITIRQIPEERKRDITIRQIIDLGSEITTIEINAEMFSFTLPEYDIQ